MLSLRQANIMDSLHVLIKTSQCSRGCPTVWTFVTRKSRQMVSLDVADNVWFLFTVVITITALVRASSLDYFCIDFLVPIKALRMVIQSTYNKILKASLLTP